jgi:histidinol-phosphatase (PHP family)
MINSLPADFHMHTHNSGDSDAPMKDMIESAIQKGLSAICFTEHNDFDYPDMPDNPPDGFEVNTEAYREEFLSLKPAYEGKIELNWGIEIGMQPHLSDKNNDYINSYPFDFVIASNHVCHRKDPYYPSFYEGRSEKESFLEFFESTLENLEKFNNYDVLGHLDYIVRYAPSFDKNYRYADYADILDAILKHLIENGKGLDVNTKSLYSKNALANPNPSKDILIRYRELGGDIITFGSDAHVPEHIAGCFDVATEMVKACGFTHYAKFSQRKQEFINL